MDVRIHQLSFFLFIVEVSRGIEKGNREKKKKSSREEEKKMLAPPLHFFFSGYVKSVGFVAKDCEDAIEGETHRRDILLKLLKVETFRQTNQSTRD